MSHILSSWVSLTHFGLDLATIVEQAGNVNHVPLRLFQNVFPACFSVSFVSLYSHLFTDESLQL